MRRDMADMDGKRADIVALHTRQASFEDNLIEGKATTNVL